MGPIERLKNYCLNSSLHGLKFVADGQRHWTERIFWIIICIASWAIATKIIMDSWELRKTNAISFVVETDYLDWNTAFPSVSVCPYNTKNIKEFTDGDFSLTNRINELVHNKWLSSEYADCYDYQGELDESEECPTENISLIVEKVRSTCEEVFSECVWNDEKFDCCKYFLPFKSECGECLTINNRYTINTDFATKYYKMISNQTTGPGTLKLRLLTNAAAYLHSEYELPYAANAIYQEIKLREELAIFFSITNTVNEKGIKSVPVHRRQCRFSEEIYMNGYDHYSFSQCVTECRMKHIQEYCNCTYHNSPRQTLKGDPPTCQLYGIYCIASRMDELTNEVDEWSKGSSGIHCSCLETCDAVDIKIIAKYPPKERNHPSANISFVMMGTPKIRYVRKVVRDYLDMVVSTGSTLGLFIGASILSFVEIFYYIIIRPISKPKTNDFEQLATLILSHKRFANIAHNIGKQSILNNPSVPTMDYTQSKQQLYNNSYRHMLY